MNKIELGWTFGKVCVPVARLGRRVGWPCYTGGFLKDWNEEGNHMSPNSLLTAPRVAVAPALLTCHSAVKGAGKASSAQTEVGVRLPSYLEMVSSIRGILSTVVPLHLLQNSHYSFPLQKKLSSLQERQKKLIHCFGSEFVQYGFQMIAKINRHSEEVTESLCTRKHFSKRM